MPDVTDQIADVAGRLSYTDGEHSLHNKIAERLRKWRDQFRDFLRAERYDQWAEVEKHAPATSTCASSQPRATAHASATSARTRSTALS